MKTFIRLPAIRFWLFFALVGILGSSPAAAQTVVTLTFDDGYVDQLAARDILDANGMKGTFFVNSGVDGIGSGGQLAVSDLIAMQSNGHEIAGHTVDHIDLTTLTPAQQAHQICDDRTTLLNDGLHVISFAYPYGSFNASAENIVKTCGYISGRIVGGLDCATGSCVSTFAEAIPPANADTVQTPDSIVSTTTVTQIEQFVINAENSGGGWVPIVFHHVCNNCDLYSTSSTTLAGFTSWLQGEITAGRVSVQTMAQVMGGDIAAPVPVISTMTPSTASAGSPGLTLTVSGLNFTASSVVLWNGVAPSSTTFVNSTTLTAQIPASDFLTVKPSSVTVSNSATESSPIKYFIVGNPVPVLTAITPVSARQGSAFTLTVLGTGFGTTASVRWNGAARTTTFVSSTTLRAAIPATDLTAPGSATITVFNPAPNGGTSGGQTLVIYPAVGQTCPCKIFPDTTVPAPGDANGETSSLELGIKFKADVNGMITGLRFYKIAASTGTHVGHLWSSSGVLLASVTYTGESSSGWQTASLSTPVEITANTTYVASYQTNTGYAITDAFFLASFDNVPLHGLSNLVDLDGVFGTGGSFPTSSANSRNYWADVVFVNDAPTIISVAPNAALVGTSTTTITVTGTNFVSSSTVQFNNVNKVTTFVNNTTLTALIPTSDLAQVKVATITVFDIGLGGSTSNGVPFTVGYPVPTLVSLSTTSVLVGSPSFALTLTGTNFLSSSTVRWNGTVHSSTTFMNSTTLRIIVLVSDLAVGGNVAVTVVSPTPGGGSSNSLNFAVGNPLPTLSSLSQSFATVGSTSTITLTVTGTHFIPTSVVDWNGSALSTTYVSSVTLSAIIPTGDLATVGASSITVINPPPAGGTTGALIFSVVAGSGGGSSVGSVSPRVFPNPWKVTLHNGKLITFDGMNSGSTVKIFTTSAHWVRTLSAPAGITTWDLKNDSGDPVASGYYIYLITDSTKDKHRGIVGIIR